MSIFNADDTNNQGEDFDTNEDFISKVVELKGEKWKEPQALAKGYLHAQQYIKELEVVKEQQAKIDYQKEILELLQGKASENKPTAPEDRTEKVATTDNGTRTSTPISEEDIQSLVAKALETNQEKSKAEANLKEVERLMSETFGTEAKSTLMKRATELGMSIEQLQGISINSPKAFMSLMGVAPTKETNSLLKGTVNTSTKTFVEGDKRNSKYYYDLMKKSPREYQKRETQMQMLADKKTLGASFFN